MPAGYGPRTFLRAQRGSAGSGTRRSGAPRLARDDACEGAPGGATEETSPPHRITPYHRSFAAHKARPRRVACTLLAA